MPAKNASANRFQNNPYTISGSVLCTHLSPESRVPHQVFRGTLKEPKVSRRCLAKRNVDGQSQCECEHLNSCIKPCLKKTQHIGSVKTYGPKIYKKVKVKCAKDRERIMQAKVVVHFILFLLSVG